MEQSSRKYFRLIAVLNLIGAALSLYSLHHHIALEYGLQTEPSFCNISAAFNCDAVNASEWSTLAGLPVASYGIVFYGLFFLFAVVALRLRTMPSNVAGASAFVVSLGAVAFSAYLFYISKFVIGTICLICLSLYVINGALLLCSYRAGRPAGPLAQLRTGLLSIVAFPVLALGLGRFRSSPHKNGACSGLFAGIVLGLVLLFQPQRLILSTIKVPASDILDPATIAREAVDAWRSAPLSTISENTAPGATHDYSKGASDAPITLVEFSDFECPACRRFYGDVKELVATYGEKIRIVHRNFPIDQTCNVHIHQRAHLNSCHAALFTRCAGEQGKFWEAADYIFTLPAIDADEPPETVAGEINAGATTLGLDTAAFGECMGAERQQQRIIQDIDEAMNLGLQSTPSVWINGRRVQRVAKPTLIAIIDHILATGGEKAP